MGPGLSQPGANTATPARNDDARYARTPPAHEQDSSSAALDLAPPSLSIVLATLNESENLPNLIQQLTTEDLPPLEIVVVDDGSTDGTREYLLDVSSKDRRVRPIFHDGAQTLTPAQCQGIVNSRGNSVVIMDADLQHPPRDVPKLVAELDRGASVVVGTRYGAGGTVGKRSADRAILSRGADGIARCLVASARLSSDPMSGFFGFRREIFRPLGLQSPGYKLLLYVLVMARGRKVAEVPYEFATRNGGTSKIAHGFGFIRVFLAEVLRARRLEERLRMRKSERAVPSIPPHETHGTSVARRVSRANPDLFPGPLESVSDFGSHSQESPLLSPSHPADGLSRSIEDSGLDVSSPVLKLQR